MNEVIIYLISFVVLLALELFYFQLAERYQIIDKPNQRSSHTQPTIRGAGVIFLFAVLTWYFFFHFTWAWFVIGAVLIAIVSFADDLKPVSSGLRASVHVLSTLLLFYQLHLFDWPILLIIAAFIVSVGALSAFNFMDGINGITGLYALVNLTTFLLVHYFITPFTDPQLLVILVISVLLFLYFNLRKKARAFAGDVGSVTLAFIQFFLMFQLIKATESLVWVGVCVVFGVDSVLTILFRIKQKENIFLPHRQHVFQYLSNELKWSHSSVSFVYAGVQLLINAMVVIAFVYQLLWVVPVMIAAYAAVFFLVRISVIKNVKAVISQ